MGADLSEILRLYPGLALMEPGKEPSLYREDNDRECLSRRTAVLRSLFIYWSNQQRRIQKLIIVGSRGDCQENRNAERESKPDP